MRELSGIDHSARRVALTSVKRRPQVIIRVLLTTGLCALLLSCASKPPADTLVMIIESSPTNLDPRVGIDGQSERIDNLIFDDLLERDENLNVKPALAERWEIPICSLMFFTCIPE